jgi:hypothetical protein
LFIWPNTSIARNEKAATAANNDKNNGDVVIIISRTDKVSEQDKVVV